MAHKAPGKHYREGISVLDLANLFPDEEAARKWIEGIRWPDEICCPRCGNTSIATVKNAKPMPYRCRGCRSLGKNPYFSVMTGTAMERSHIPLRKWTYGVYLCLTSLKGVSSMKLHRDLDISQKSAWFMAHRLREAFTGGPGLFEGPVEVDEVYMGGKRKNMSLKKRAQLTGRGPVGKTAVAGMKDRKTNRVSAEVVPNTTKATLQRFVHVRTEPDAKVYTDDASPYASLDNHETVKHSHLEYVRGDVHTNGVESFWSMLKRAHMGTYHKLSEQHLQRYVNEFAARQNLRPLNTLDQMRAVFRGLIGKRLTYKQLVEG